MKHLIRALWVMMCFLLPGCSTLAPQTASGTTSPVPSRATAASAASGVPEKPTVSDKSGAVVGQLLDLQGKPIEGLAVYVATVTRGPNGQITTISFTLNGSKRGMTDAQGHFVINTVDASSYALALYSPGEQFLVPDETGKQGTALQVDVKNGQVTDVGTLKVRRPR